MIRGALLLQILVIGFLLNVIWEFSHCFLYKTCREQPWRQKIPLLLSMAVKDGCLIALFYVVAAFIFGVTNILESPLAVVAFVALGSAFSILDEKISIRRQRWEYTAAMPTIYGVGISPLLEISLTGILTLVFVF